jgi:hypothetical protein
MKVSATRKTGTVMNTCDACGAPLPAVEPNRTRRGGRPRRYCRDNQFCKVRADQRHRARAFVQRQLDHLKTRPNPDPAAVARLETRIAELRDMRQLQRGFAARAGLSEQNEGRSTQ